MRKRGLHRSPPKIIMSRANGRIDWDRLHFGIVIGMDRTTFFELVGSGGVEDIVVSRSSRRSAAATKGRGARTRSQTLLGTFLVCSPFGSMFVVGLHR